MSRLADYFIVIGYDHDKDRNGSSEGRILQRFPENDWEACPFTQSIELFCRPVGWTLSAQRQPPEFFVAVLTDIDADRHYLSVLTFSESIAVSPTKSDDGDTEEDSALNIHSLMYSPKCLVLVSRLDYFETFKNCLGIIYTAYVDKLDVQLEVLVGNILGCVQVPPPGGPQIRFSIGAGDRQALQPPVSATVPSSRNVTALLFQQLGIQNVLTLFCAALTDHKILFHSQSHSRLTDACQAINILQYPLRYSYVYVPILPAPLVEVLNTPTPFIAGVHSSLAEDTADLVDVIIVDLDGGSVHIPECVNLPMLPEPMVSRAKKALTMIDISSISTLTWSEMVMNSDLLMADYAFPPPSPKKPPSLEQKDKEIRAIFIRFFAELLTGYRSCLTVIRIHPEPFITFHKANFLGHRGMVDDEFLVRVLEGMGFGTFVAERGTPYRTCDIFDEVYANIHDQLTEESADSEKIMEHIKDLAKQLNTNENPNPQPYVQKVPKPTDGAYSRIHQTPFPSLDSQHVHKILKEGIEKQNQKMAVRPNQVRIVPMGTPITALVDRQRMMDNNARRLEVLRNCINFVFDNKISDARIIFPAVLRALKSRVTRLALTQELSYHIRSNRAVLEHQQFDLVVKLLNCCLQNDSSMDENGVAAAILPLATTFCRKLCTGIIQFAYTCVQEHAVWQNMQFWEAAFYQDVQKQIQQLYAPQYEENNVKDKKHDSFLGSPTHKNNELNVSKNCSNGGSVTPERRSSYRGREMGALEIAAEQLRTWSTLSEEKKEELISNEESTVYSQAIHYANRMVYMKVPLETQKSIKSLSPDWDSTSNSNIASSLADSESNDAESGYDEMEISDVGTSVIKFVTRFVDKVCNDSRVTPEHIKSLHQMIPGVVAMHIETLEAVNRESKRLPPIQKPKILKPTLLPGEEVVMDGLRVYLLPDGREEGLGGNMGGPTLLPAEGAIFLTNYRIIFKGTPCDPLACEQIVIRSFPISTLTKEKLVKLQYTPHIDQLPKEGLQLRSCIFQLMKIAFDEEVVPDDLEAFRKLSMKYRSPTSVFMTFAFVGQSIPQPSTMLKPVEKNASLKNFAKKTIMKTARKAGIAKQKPPKRKYVLPTPPMGRRSMSPRSSAGSDSESDRPVSEAMDDLSIIDEGEFNRSWLSDPKVIERLMERPGYQDYVRQGFGDPSDSSTVTGKSTEKFRISTVNSNFSVSKSYPALLVVPANFPDDSIRKFARTHRQYRFPVVTWRHPRTKALLLRASGFHGRGLMGMLKSDPATGTSTGEISASLQQERYFSCIVSATPNSMRSYKPSYSDSLTSLDSLMLTGVQESLLVPETPEVVRRSHPAATGSLRNINNPKTSSNRDSVYSIAESNPVTGRSSLFLRAVNMFRPGGAKSSPEPFSRIGSIREKPRMNSNSATLDSTTMLHQNGGVNERSDLLQSSVQGLKRVALYVLGEKAQMKGIKAESFPKCDFIPVDFYEVRHVKASFKKLMRACVPSAPLPAETGFLKLVEESEWLLQIQNIMQLAGATEDLLDVQGSSVMLCLEDGWDCTTQVVSVAQLLLDPYYRTIEGFKCLVEKEWLSFGHRFTHRSNQTIANHASGFAPLFLQFLDVVHQIHNQFPLSFEFNQFFLRFIAYHYVSNRFRTFMMDNEYERVEAGWLMEDRRSSKINHEQADLDGGFATRHQSHQGSSIWDYIEKHHRKSTLFMNFYYSPSDQDVVLRPYSNISNLKIWDYFLNEDLAHGPAYEIETTNKEIQMSEEEKTDSAGQPLMRRIVNGCHDNVFMQQPNVFRQKLQEIHKLETDLGHFQQKWKTVWDKLELPTGKRETMQRNLSFNTQIVKSHGRSIHKRSTLEILVKGKMLGEAAKMFSQPHRFEKHTYTTPAYCDYCSQVLWGLLKTGMHCTDCGYNCHEKCLSHVPKNCTKLKIVSDSSSTNTSVSRVSDTSTLKNEELPVESGPTYATYTPATTSTENSCLHKGYLFKRGALLKGWKQRWFVLDSTKHQLRYYDSEEDTNCKGYIELFDVQSVQTIRNVQGAPKKADENAFFELKTNRRMYNFLAADAKTAQSWIDRIHSFI